MNIIVWCSLVGLLVSVVVLAYFNNKKFDKIQEEISRLEWNFNLFTRKAFIKENRHKFDKLVEFLKLDFYRIDLYNNAISFHKKDMSCYGRYRFTLEDAVAKCDEYSKICCKVKRVKKDKKC